MTDHSPILTSLGEDQIQSFSDYMEVLRADNVVAASDEAKRLAAYFEALSRQLATDAEAAPEKAVNVDGFSSPQELSSLFNAVAQRTHNTILSEVILAPQTLLLDASTRRSCTQFTAFMNYEGRTFSFGFVQTLPKKNSNTGAVSVPILAFNDKMMNAIAPFHPEDMFRGMQAVATAGNHDMLHHFTNTVLNPRISYRRLDKFPEKPVSTPGDWSENYFSHFGRDSDVSSYESWLMLDHMRVRRLMEEGPEGLALAQSCDMFFDELDRIGKDFAASAGPQEAHNVIDYFGTMLLFSMMRYMPLDHPLLQHAVERLHQADPQPEAIEARAADILEMTKVMDKIDRFKMGYVEKTVSNYKDRGIDLMPEKPDYASLKKLQMIGIAPWMTHLLSPAAPESPLSKAKEASRVGNANLDMVSSSAAGIWFNMIDGVHTLTKPDGTAIEVHLQDGLYHREGGPAVIVTYPDGKQKKKWYTNGHRHRWFGKKEPKEPLLPPA